MTVSVTTSVISYSYTGPDDYTFPFRVFEDSDLVLKHTDAVTGVITTLVLNTDYTVTLVVGVVGGTCVLTYAPTTGTLVIARQLPKTQETDWLNNDPLDAEQLEIDFDRIVMILQELGYDALNVQQWRGDWVTGQQYNLNDLIISADDGLYICLEAHTSGTFSTDLAADKWALIMADVAAAVAAAQAAQAAAETAQTNAETAQTNAETAETNAETAETNAETAQTNAETAATEAEHWAQYPEDSQVPESQSPPEYSAYHWSLKAADVGGVPEAPSDEIQHGRVDGSWEQILMNRVNLFNNGEFKIWQRGAPIANPESDLPIADQWWMTRRTVTGGTYSADKAYSYKASMLVLSFSGLTANYTLKQKVEYPYRFHNSALTLSFIGLSSVAQTFFVKVEVKDSLGAFTTLHTSGNISISSGFSADRYVYTTPVLDLSAITLTDDVIPNLQISITVNTPANGLLYLTQMQLELGTDFSGYEFLNEGEYLRQCYRYYHVGSVRGIPLADDTTLRRFHYLHPTVMRAAPTVTEVATVGTASGSLASSIYAVFANYIATSAATYCSVQWTSEAEMT